MVKAMDSGKLPATVASKESKKKIYNAEFVAHYKETGMDKSTGKPPKGQNLAWVLAEVARQEQVKAVNAV